MIRRHPSPILYTGCPVSPMPRRVRFGRWRWEIRDTATGPLLAEGTTRTRAGAMRRREKARARCERKPTDPPAATITAMLARYGEELHDAAAAHDEAQFWRLAALAEAPFRTSLGERMRAVVDAERAQFKAATGAQG